ncbi:MULTISPECIES: CPCC family cysteine-rich protein [Nocardioides]|uniref:CPCC family cysteine-rich protein n=1 Tax=Nocardioides vastitatis TaxID=2568655 RepID=A0ABW0ZL71_9ACTN|nr:CPCC family cysteine-rich protein [Nocardioides sp.]
MPGRYVCPCCGYRTLNEGPAAYDVCPVCDWEDDGGLPWQCDGPNGISLVEAQQRFLTRSNRLRRKMGRDPFPEEARDPEWRPLEVTDALLARVEQERLALERELERDASEGEARWDGLLAGFNADLQALETDAAGLSYEQVKERYRAICEAHEFPFPEPELELMARLVHDRHWRFRHPNQALGWAWRHRQSATLWVRVRQVVTGSIRFAG